MWLNCEYTILIDTNSCADLFSSFFNIHPSRSFHRNRSDSFHANPNANRNSFLSHNSTHPVLYKIVGTTLSLLNGNEDLYLPTIIKATIAGKTGDLQRCNNWNTTMVALNLTNFYSARAILDPSRATELAEFDTVDTYPSNSTPLALQIYSNPGLRTRKLHISFPPIVILSLLILLQIVGLLALAVYTSM